jgi:tripartite-type tricarboxylate transporter receptor subunit TctC
MSRVCDLLAGTVHFAILGLGPTLQLLRDGKLVPLAVSTAKRTPALPNVPTLLELGFDGFNAPQWLGFAAPRVLSDDLVSLLSQMVAKTLLDPTISKRLDGLGFQPLFLDGAAMASRISEEEQRWRSIVATAKLDSR